MKTIRLSTLASIVITLFLLVADLHAGTVTATLKNVSGANAPAAGTRLVLYTSPSRQSTGANPATFASVAAGTYTLEGYYSSTFWGEEYWASQNVIVPASGTVSPNVTRHYPYVSSIVFKIHSSGATISAGQSIQLGTQLRVEVTIQNNSSSALNCRPHVAVDRSQSASYDHDLNWTAQSVSSGGSRLFSTTFTPTTTAQYYFAYEAQTTLLNGNTLRTDSAGWQQTFQIVCPTPSAPSGPSPSSGATGVNPPSVTLSWSAASGSTSYDVYFGTDSSPDSGELQGNTTSTQWPISGLVEATTYYWKVAAKNSCGSTDSSVWSFTTARTTGDVNATLKNANGANAPAAGTRMVLYTSPSRQVSGSNPTSFTFVPPGTLTLEGFYTGTFWGEEFWASQDLSVSAGQTTSANVTRRYPYALSVVISNVTSGGVISSGQTLPAGTQVRAFVRVTNALASAALNSRVRFVFDISQSEPYGEFDSTSSFQPVAALGSRTFAFDFTPTVAGQYWFAYRVDTTLLNGNTLATDSAGWQQTFQSLQGLTILGRVAYHSYSGYLASPIDANDGHIFLFSLPNGTLRRLTQGQPIQNAMNPHMSADGSQIVFMAIPQGGALNRNSLETYVYDLATESLTRLTTNGVPDEDAKFSPDGQKIVFKRNGQVWAMNADGSNPVQLTATADEKSGPNYSPDGADIIYWSDAGANADVWRMTAAGTGAANIIGTASLQEYYPIYRDAQSILYTRWESTGDAHDKIYSYVIASATTQRLAVNQTGANDSDPFPVDSNLIGISSDRSGGDGGYDVYVGNPSTGAVYPLPAANSTLHDLGGWYSPYSDARKLVVLNPASGAQLTSGSTVVLTARGYSNGGVWHGASPKIVLQGPVSTEFTGLHDDGINGDQTAGDGIYSKSVTLPAQAGSYTGYASANTTDNGIAHEIRSASKSFSLLTVIANQPSLSNPQLSGTTFRVSASSQVGFNYILEFKNSLSDANWTPVRTNSGNGGQITLTNTGTVAPSRVYRVRVQ